MGDYQVADELTFAQAAQEGSDARAEDGAPGTHQRWVGGVLGTYLAVARERDSGGRAFFSRRLRNHDRQEEGERMKNVLRTLMVAALVVTVVRPAVADEILAKFKGGIGVNPVSNVVGTEATGDATRNVVRGIAPGGQPWVIESLKADVTVDGRIRVDGRGLLLSGGNGIGTTGGQQVKALLFCGPVPGFTVHSSGLVALEPDGDFRIDDVLDSTPPSPCENPVLLIVNAGDRWFAAGIPQR